MPRGGKAVSELAAQVAKSAGVDAAAAERVLRALNVDSHIAEASSLMGGKLDLANVKLAYRISSGGIIA
jgi:hypothetical protein